LCKIASILKQNMAILAVRKKQIYTLKIPGNGVLTGLDFNFFFEEPQTPRACRGVRPLHPAIFPPSQKSNLRPW
jgi:hypothetical protein